MIFVISQFFMGYALSGRDQALQKLEEQVTELGELLSLERKNNEKLLTELQASLSAQDTLRAKAATLSSENTNYKRRIASLVLEINNAEKLLKNKQVTISSNITQIKQLSSQGKQLQEQLSGLRNKITIKDLQLGKEKKLSKSALDRLAMLNRQIRTLKSQLNFISMALEKSEILAKKRRVKIANLGKRLNAALASKVQELSRYRSEFFGELRKVLGSESGIQIVGDRFVFQSEVLFEKGQSELGVVGREGLDQLASTLLELSKKIPPESILYKPNIDLIATVFPEPLLPMIKLILPSENFVDKSSKTNLLPKLFFNPLKEDKYIRNGLFSKKNDNSTQNKSEKAIKIIKSLEKNSIQILANQSNYITSIDRLISIFRKKKHRLVFIRDQVRNWGQEVKGLAYERQKLVPTLTNFNLILSEALFKSAKSEYANNIVNLSRRLERFNNQMDKFEAYVNNLESIAGKQAKGLVYLIKEGEEMNYEKKYKKDLENYQSILKEIPKMIESV